MRSAYLVTVEPINGDPIKSAIAKYRYREAVRKNWKSREVPRGWNPSKDEVAVRERFLQVNDLRLFRVSTVVCLMSDDEQALRVGVQTLRAVVQSEFCSEWSSVSTSEFRGLELLRGLDLARFSARLGDGSYMSASDAARFIRLPSANIPGIETKVTIDLAIPKTTKESKTGEVKGVGELELGRVVRNGQVLQQVATLPLGMLSGHMAVFGASRSGKTNFVKDLVVQLLERDVRVLVFDAHNEYVDLPPLVGGDVWVIDPMTSGFSINVLELPDDMDPSDSAQVSPFVENLVVLVRSLFLGSTGPVLEGLARESLYSLYVNRKMRTPTFGDWLEEAGKVVEGRDERYRNAFDSLNARLSKFMQGWYGQFFNQPRTTLPIGEVLKKPVFIQLRGMDSEAQSFLVASTLKMIFDYKKRYGASKGLHVSILEESHLYVPRIFRASSSFDEMSRVSASLFLAEAAKFNHALVLVDQSPSRVAEDAIINCNSLVVFRVFYELDKRVILTALGYDPNSPQGIRLGEYLTSLEQGHAIVRTATSLQPFEVKTKLLQTKAKPSVDVSQREDKGLETWFKPLPPTSSHQSEVGLPSRTDRSWRIVDRLSGDAKKSLISLSQKEVIFGKNEVNREVFNELRAWKLIVTTSEEGDVWRTTHLGENVASILRVQSNPQSGVC